MKYMLLIYSNELDTEQISPQDMAKMVEDYAAYTNEMVEAGVFVHTEGLQPTTTATSIQVRDGKTLTTHGPFIESKEQLGGFYVIDCDNLDEAIKWAAKCPTAAYGNIEIRPVASYQ